MKYLLILFAITILAVSCDKEIMGPDEPVLFLQEFVIKAVYVDSFYNVFTGDRNTWTDDYENIDFNKPIILNRLVLYVLGPHTFDGLYEFSVGKNDTGGWIETRYKAFGINHLGKLAIPVFIDCIFIYENGLKLNNLCWQIKAPTKSGGMHVYATASLLAYLK